MVPVVDASHISQRPFTLAAFASAQVVGVCRPHCAVSFCLEEDLILDFVTLANVQYD